MTEEILKRFGIAPESAERLAEQAADFGSNRPAQAHRVVVTDQYDGAVEALVQFRDGGTVYRLDMLSDHSARPRTWTVRPMQADALDEFVRIVAQHIPPNWPVWIPTWKFPTEAILRSVTDQTQSIMDRVGEPCGTISSTDPYGFKSYTYSRTVPQAV